MYGRPGVDYLLLLISSPLVIVATLPPNENDYITKICQESLAGRPCSGGPPERKYLLYSADDWASRCSISCYFVEHFIENTHCNQVGDYHSERTTLVTDQPKQATAI
ncbi:hypothetical protein PSHT_14957 [Puccinia striiformis]|uniref:Secreted protein n=1 Tax=Puccinia striiformis TaxID=27350 RepID=A0A2S4UHQ2_9BASI|nr:hypothetical protein PSHT_14957 [Puccinia striiformis]